MVGSCTTNQENWTMLAFMFAGFGAYLYIKWTKVNEHHSVSFTKFLKQLLSG